MEEEYLDSQLRVTTSFLQTSQLFSSHFSASVPIDEASSNSQTSKKNERRHSCHRLVESLVLLCFPVLYLPDVVIFEREIYYAVNVQMYIV
jgi:hypothetical protein